jgi:hypothetical protein
MNKEQAQQSALEQAELNMRSVAVAYTNDGVEWQAGSHSESKYLKSYFTDAIEIWVASRYMPEPKWTCYLSPSNPVDYVAETGATGERAEMLRRVMAAMEDFKRNRE